MDTYLYMKKIGGDELLSRNEYPLTNNIGAGIISFVLPAENRIVCQEAASKRSSRGNSLLPSLMGPLATRPCTRNASNDRGYRYFVCKSDTFS
jgi:hypothetical protein